MKRKMLYCLLAVFFVVLARSVMADTAPKKDSLMSAAIKKLTMPELSDDRKPLTRGEIGPSADIRESDLWFNSGGRKIDLQPYLSTEEFAVVVERYLRDADTEYRDYTDRIDCAGIKDYFSALGFQLVREAERGDYIFLVYGGLPHWQSQGQFLSFLNGMNRLAAETKFPCSLMPIFYLPGEGARVLTGNLLITIRGKSMDGMSGLYSFIMYNRLNQPGIDMRLLAYNHWNGKFDHISIVARITAKTKKNVFSLAHLVEDSPTAAEKEKDEFSDLDRGKVEAIPELVRIPGALHVETSVEEPDDPYVGSTWNLVMSIEGDRDTAILLFEFNKESPEMQTFISNSGLPKDLLRVGKPIIERSVSDRDNRARMTIKLPLTILKPGSRSLPGFTLRYSFLSELDSIDAKNYTTRSYSYETEGVKFYVPVLAAAKMANVYPPASPAGIRVLSPDFTHSVFVLILMACGVGLLLWGFLAGRQKKTEADEPADIGPKAKIGKLLTESDRFFDKTADVKAAKHRVEEIIALVEAVCGSSDAVVQTELQSWRDKILARPDASIAGSLPEIKKRLHSGLEKIIGRLPEGG